MVWDWIDVKGSGKKGLYIRKEGQAKDGDEY